MSEFKHILLQTGVEEIFRLDVYDSIHAGQYTIVKPDGWDEIDAEISINEEMFNVEDFILGQTNKLKFLQYNDEVGFDIVKKVYEEKGGDGKIVFRWFAELDGNTIDLLGERFELNLNKYDEGFEKSMLKIEVELKLRDSQNKVLNREDTTVDLFSEKSLDNNAITSPNTIDIVYKSGAKTLQNFYFLNFDAKRKLGFLQASFAMPFSRSDDYEFGDNKNTDSGYWNSFPNHYYAGELISSLQDIKNLNLEISNLEVLFSNTSNTFPNVKLYAVKYSSFNYLSLQYNNAEKIPIIETPETVTISGINYTKFKITNQVFDIGNLEKNIKLLLVFETTGAIWVNLVNEETSLTLSVEVGTPTIKTKVLRLKEALNQLVKNYTDGNSSVESNVLSIGGYFYNTGLVVGQFLRGIGNVAFFEKKIKTSIKSALYDGSAPLLALGFDVLDDKVIVEDVDYFFKNICSYDFSDKEFLNEGYKLENDFETSYNTLLFGSKKYSTKNKRDLSNYNTKLEATTPLVTVKKKFDKQTDCIIDEYKIAELIDDSSSATNDNDDDLVLIDLVQVESFHDYGTLVSCNHTNESGYLVLVCYDPAFDLLPINVGDSFTIEDGINAGTYEILEIDRSKLKLNKTSEITLGTYNTPVSYTVSNVIKNRTNEGFTAISNVKDIETCTNLRYNPKYHLARWFGFFGGGLTKKENNKEIIINNYKNNGKVTVSVNSPELANELPGIKQLDVNLTLDELRQYKEPYFCGKGIEITLKDVMFYEFLECFNNWRYGEGNDRNFSRGYITVSTPEGLANIYPFGNKAFSYDKKFNELTIKGKVKTPLYRNRIHSEQFTTVFN